MPPRDELARQIETLHGARQGSRAGLGLNGACRCRPTGGMNVLGSSERRRLLSLIHPLSRQSQRLTDQSYVASTMKLVFAALLASILWGCATSDTDRLVRDHGLTRPQAQALLEVEEFSVEEVLSMVRSHGLTLAEFARMAEVEFPTLDDAVRHGYCSGLDNSGDDVFSVAETAGWRVGPLPVWSTPGAIRQQLGEPDSTFRVEKPWGGDSGFMRFVIRSDTAWFNTFRDRLAFPTEFPLSLGALTTDRGTFEAGTAESEVAAAFAESYRCRNWPPAAAGPSLCARPYDTAVFVDDQLETGGRLVLWLRDGRLEAVGVDDYWGAQE